MKNNLNLCVEGLRGACIVVLLFHVFCRFSQIFLDANIGWMSMFGSFGTSIFLIITGYYLVDFKK